MEIIAENVIEAWRAAIAHILAHGRVYIDNDGRECHEVDRLIVTVNSSSTAAEGVRAMRLSKRWRYPSEEELTNIMLNQEAATGYEYLYGRRIFAYDGKTNQVDDYLIPLLTKKPQTRRAIISLLNPTKDAEPDAKNVLGILTLHFRIIDGKLAVTAVIRTSGFFTGWPANLFQVAQLQEYVARAIQLPAGSITTISLAAHIYTESFDDIESVLGEEALRELRR